MELTIQEYAQMVADVARVENAKEAYNMAEKEFDITIDKLARANDDEDVEAIHAANEEWLERYAAKKKAAKKIEREVEAFLSKYLTEEYSEITVDARYNVAGNLDKFWYIRYAILRASKDVKFNTK